MQTNAQWLRSHWILLLVITVGIVLRFMWTSDMEWKDDEKLMFNTAQQVVATGHLPAVGMKSGGGVVNPVLSIAVFSAMAYVAHTPIAMAHMVQLLNVIAILLFLLFIVYKVEPSQREIWLFGLALAAVSPLAVLFSRKIWAQDVLPFFCVIILWCHANRNKPLWALIWGLTGALIGQIHMSGFFYSAGLVLFTVIYDYRNGSKTKWVYWLVGSTIGGLGLIPWLQAVFHQQTSGFAWDHALEFNFYIYWLLDGHGICIAYSLRKEFIDFIKWPAIAGMNTYFVAVLNAVLALTALYTLKILIEYVKSVYNYIKQKQLWNRLTINLTTTDFYLLSILLGLGVFMNFSGILVMQHYLIVAFPFSYVFMAKIFQPQKKLLYVIICIQLLVTVSFLTYIHTHGGAPKGDYGVNYKMQG